MLRVQQWVGVPFLALPQSCRFSHKLCEGREAYQPQWENIQLSQSVRCYLLTRSVELSINLISIHFN